MYAVAQMEKWDERNKMQRLQILKWDPVSLKPVPGQSSSVIGTKTVPWSLHECKETDALEALEQTMFTLKSTKMYLQYHLNPQWSMLQV